MRLGRIFGIPLRINPAAFLMIILAIWLGEVQRLCVMSASIMLHELMHIAAARLLHVRVIELELMPTGGAARIENLWRLRSSQAAMVALAGPLGNWLIMITAAAMCQWELLAPAWAAILIEQNAVILIFNLIPALPMDGGRVLCGLLSSRLSLRSAARAGGCAAYLLAAILMLVSVYGLMYGQLNITLPCAALFLLTSVRREQRQAECSALESLTGRFSELQEEVALPVRWLAVGLSTTVRETASRLKPRYMHMIAVYDDELSLSNVVSERELLDALFDDGDTKMSSIGLNVKNVNLKKC